VISEEDRWSVDVLLEATKADILVMWAVSRTPYFHMQKNIKD
jgi:hypothetical protein